MTNKYEKLLKQADMIELKLDMVAIQEIVEDSFNRDLNINMKDKFILYSDDISHSIGIKIFEEELTLNQLDELAPYYIGEDFINMDIAMFNFFKDIGVNPHSTSVVALDNDNEPHTPCEITIFK